MMDANIKEHRRKGAANCHGKMGGRKRHKEQRPPFNQLKHSRSRDTIESKEKEEKERKIPENNYNSFRSFWISQLRQTEEALSLSLFSSSRNSSLVTR